MATAEPNFPSFSLLDAARKTDRKSDGRRQTHSTNTKTELRKYWHFCALLSFDIFVLFVSLNKNKYSLSTFLTQDHVLDTDEGDLNDAGTTKIRPINIGYGSY